ncbi:MAG: HD domain-containing protein [Clostridia bacterium]|nr:HD domain-containing protein [Clostridia bacterium]
MKFEKYYRMVEEQSKIYDKTQNCEIGQTWRFHLHPVINRAMELAEKYGADKSVVEVATLFHDYANLVDYANSDNHHILGAIMAEEILLKDGYNQDFIDRVKACIENHRASVVREKYTIEEICVADADAISHLDSVVELICWRAYLGEDIMTANNFVKNKIKKSYNKMSDETKEYMKEKYENIMNILF